jgi:cell wall-associated NlpC family hydrolase
MIDVDDLIGLPYQRAGRDPKTGIDCFYLLLEVYRRLGIEVKDVAPEAYEHDAGVVPELALAEFGALWRRTSYHALRFADVALVRYPITETSRELHVSVVVELGPVRVLHAHAASGSCLVRLEALRPWVVGLYTYTGEHP